MLVNFFTDEDLQRDCDISFSYRYSLEYERGFRARVRTSIEATPLILLDLDSQISHIQPRPLRIVIRVVAEGLFLKHLYFWLNRRRQENFFRKRRIDVLHINNGGYPGAPSCSSAALAAHTAGVNHIVYVVNNIATKYSVFGRWFDARLDRKVSTAVSRFVTGSTHAGVKLAEVLGLAPGKVIKIHNGICPRPLTEPSERVLERIGLPVGSPIFGIVAIHVKRKGHMVAVQAWRVLKTVMGDSLPILIIEGDGPLRGALEAEVREQGLEQHVHFIGKESNVFDFINALDVLIVPSIADEDFPNITLEAMSLGKPVIASRLSGIAEQVEDNETGLLVGPGNARELALAVQKLADDPAARRRMGAVGQQRFRTMFSAPFAVRNYKDLYFQLMDMRKS